MRGSTAPPITRNLTTTFVRCRNDRRNKGRNVFGFGTDAENRPFRDVDADVHGQSVEMTAMVSMPPEWTDCASEAREDIKQIREKLVQLTKLQQKRLLKVFVDDAAPDKDVEQISSSISGLIRRCEQQIHHVKTRGSDSTQKEQQCRENVQRNLATHLQQLSQQFRQAQKDYLGEIKGRQGAGSLWEGPDAKKGGGDAPDTGFTDAQLAELDSMEINADQRSAEICQIASSISDLHTIFKELAVLVIDQGTILDRIDYNIEQVVVQSVEANKQLQKAEKSQKSNRAMKCIMVLVVINLVLICILVVKTRH